MANEEKFLKPVHPGEVLDMEFLKPLKLSQNKLARDIGVPPRRINEIVHGKRAITADTAIRLSRYFGTSAQFWLNLQTEYELDCIIYAEKTGGEDKFKFIRAFKPVAAILLFEKKSSRPEDFNSTLPGGIFIDSKKCRKNTVIPA